MSKISIHLPLSHLAEAKRKAIRWIASHGQLTKKIVGTNLAFAMLAGGMSTSLVSPVDMGLNLPQTPLTQAISQTTGTILPQTDIYTQSGIQLPVIGYVITQGFSSWHPGVDLAVKIGTPVRPIMAGIVEKVDHSKVEYGNSIIINHGDGITTLYAHLSKTNVKEGDEVNLDTIIGLSGSTGHSTGPHLHFEFREDGKAISPFTVLSLIPKRTIAIQQ